MVLTGGGSVRLGRDKATTVVSGRRMIDRVLAQIPAEVPVVVVGPDPGTDRQVTVTREDPPGGGPAAAIGAGLPHVDTEWVAVIAADMPFAVDVVIGLLNRLGSAQAVVPQAQDHPQPLCALYRAEVLRALDLAPGTSMRALLADLDVDYAHADPQAFIDIDTPADLILARRRLAIMESDDKGNTMQQWVTAVQETLGLEQDVDIDLVLDVAKDVAHGVQRPAAPVTAYLMGLAVGAGADPAQAAAQLQELANNWPAPDA
jgi:molybdopterin-guanine dinucleotide biosynthesis protein A